MTESVKVHTAKRRHLCDACHLWINPGEQYERARYWDGFAGVTRQHMLCAIETRRVGIFADSCVVGTGWLRDKWHATSAEWRAWFEPRDAQELADTPTGGEL